MKKAYTIFISIIVCIFVYFCIRFIWEYLKDFNIFISHHYNEASTSGTFAFKTTPENLEVVNSYLEVNNSFVDEMSKEVYLENNIKNIYNLTDKFPSFKSYYSARLKLENAVFNGLPFLINNTVSLSDAELEAFLKDNLNYLDKTFGITTLEKLKNIIINLDSLEDKNIEYCELVNNSTIYNPYGNSTVFRLKVGNNINDFVYFSINAHHGYNTENQQAPIIIFNALGGTS